uniref:KIAA1549-like b n=1 Tax=Erpetoichthys calabaricus TaxID=27687 RepID=A0A8C4RUB5_ERPCA
MLPIQYNGVGEDQNGNPKSMCIFVLVLRFVGPTDNIQSCSFTQTMEERLQNAFEEAEATILNAHNILSVQILSTSQSIGSPAVSLIYVVWNQTKLLNGTISSSLLNQLTAELVGYYLLFPPLIIAERTFCLFILW